MDMHTYTCMHACIHSYMHEYEGLVDLGFRVLGFKV